ncbi:U3 small nucleolar RNA-associated protein 11 [Rhynchospora pubera]|uniref:U3 small nucleolar RNA-associated protein 11 n=1 Tax=Rhynchospora pubera TaxID=906938 RepID=A0AAV8C542_9POAL|nr:U3 small nucleolar RNA-associated protein 11 [Rhynchospora pubera]KAJ4796419.1 U3 small nucleolar RNA-associated protein 11 [Rhynchospora pubera]
MSSLRNAIPRRAHKERAQPQSRKSFGLLEKHKDYVLRAKNFHRKEETLKKLREKASFRNPDEFYFKMVHTRNVDGIHRPRDEANKYTAEELLVMKTQDIGYVLQKLQSEKKKVERLSSALHALDEQPNNKHVYFAEDRDEAKEIKARVADQDKILPGSEHIPDNIKRKLESSYKELSERKERVRKLEKLYSEMMLKKELQQKPGRVRKLKEEEMTSPTDKPVYKWRTERKR